MKTALLSLVLTLATAASFVVILDRLHGARRISEPERLERIETHLANLDKELESLAIAVRQPVPLDEGKSEKGRQPAPLLPRVIEIQKNLEDLADMVFDAERTLRRDLMRLHEQLGRKIDEIETRSGPPEDPEAMKLKVRKKLSELGVTVREKEGFIEFAGRIEEPSRAMELLAAGPGGRLHECLFSTPVLPSAIKIGLEDLGLKEAGEPERETGEWPGEPDGAYIYLQWGENKPRRVEDLVMNRETGKPMERARWVFTASRFFTDHRTWERLFAADVYKNIFAITRNYSEEAILACSLESAWNENIWWPHAERVPPVGTEVKILVSKDPKKEWDEAY